MPRKKNPKNLKINRIEKIISMRSPKSYQSLLYGVLTVVAIFIVVFFGIQIVSQRNNPSIGDDGVTIVEKNTNTYTVKSGDSLWAIAVEKYGDGYKWVEIEKANNLSDPGIIETGMKLVIPSLNLKIADSRGQLTPTLTPTPTQVVKPTQVVPTKSSAIKQNNQVNDVRGYKIYGPTYTVVTGDNLWNIAVRAYNNGYKWVDIAKANKLANPDIIHAGNKFILPR